jgi:hypothetical protein
MVQEHEREQALHLGRARHELLQQPAETDGLVGQVAADELVAGRRDVALVEDEVDDAQHRVDALGELGRGRDPVGDPGVPDLALGPGESLRHGRLGEHEGAGDLRGGEAAERAQRERDLGVERERRVAAGEDQA